ncbi:hypothetical protein PMAYCL1PPCAC_27047, partial [Pristionchus mayeri]
QEEAEGDDVELVLSLLLLDRVQLTESSRERWIPESIDHETLDLTQFLVRSIDGCLLTHSTVRLEFLGPAVESPVHFTHEREGFPLGGIRWKTYLDIAAGLVIFSRHLLRCSSRISR